MSVTLPAEAWTARSARSFVRSQCGEDCIETVGQCRGSWLQDKRRLDLDDAVIPYRRDRVPTGSLPDLVRNDFLPAPDCPAPRQVDQDVSDCSACLGDGVGITRKSLKRVILSKISRASSQKQNKTASSTQCAQRVRREAPFRPNPGTACLGRRQCRL